MSGSRVAPVARAGEAAGRDGSMAAVIVHTFGQPMRLVRLPLPRVKAGHALIRVEASG
jgi:hypothetical protein